MQASSTTFTYPAVVFCLLVIPRALQRFLLVYAAIASILPSLTLQAFADVTAVPLAIEAVSELAS